MPSPHRNNSLDKPLPLASPFLAIDTETAPNFNKNNPQTEVIEIAAVLLGYGAKMPSKELVFKLIMLGMWKS